MGEFSINGQYSNSDYYNAQTKGTKRKDESYTTGFDKTTNPIAEDWRETFGLSLSTTANNATDGFTYAGVKPLDAERTADIEKFTLGFDRIYESIDIDGIENEAGAEVAYCTIDAYQTGSAKRYEASGKAIDLLFNAGFSPEEIDAFMYAGQQA